MTDVKKIPGKQRGIFHVAMSNMSPTQDASLRVRKGTVVVAVVRSKEHSNLISWCRNNPTSDETKSLRAQLEQQGFTLQDMHTILS